VSLADARKEPEAPHRGADKGERLTFNAAYDLYKPVLAPRKPRPSAGLQAGAGEAPEALPGLQEATRDRVRGHHRSHRQLSRSERRNTLAVGRTFFRWCVRPPRRYLKHSPLEGVELPKPRKGKRILEPDEIKIVWNAAKGQGYPYGSICQLLIVTGQRGGEIANLRRPWINEKDRTITLPEWVCKNSKEHTFPYGDLVAGILETVPRRNGHGPALPSTRSTSGPCQAGASTRRSSATAYHAGPSTTCAGRTGASTGKSAPRPRSRSGSSTTLLQCKRTSKKIYDRWHYLPQMRTAVQNFENHLTALLARSS